MSRISFLGVLVAASIVTGGLATAAERTYKGRPISQLMSSGGLAAWRVRAKPPVGRASAATAGENAQEESPWIDPAAPLEGFPSLADEGGEPGRSRGGRNVFVNDPCMDPPPPSRARTVQSETELAVLNGRQSQGRKIVVGYNDSWGFYNTRQGLSGFAYSVDGGVTFVDGGGLPPVVKAGAACGTPGQDCYAGDPVVVVNNRTETFYYASIYLTPNGFQTLAVNRGRFTRQPPPVPESRSNTRCAADPSKNGIPDPPPANQERITWEPPVVAVSEAELGGGPSPDPDLADALDKEWLYVDQRTGVLYMTYTRFGLDGSTPIEMVRSYDGGRTWTPPSVIVPNLPLGFNQATQPIVTSSGRVLVTWHARIFAAADFSEIDQQIQAAWSDNDGNTFEPAVTVTHVNPQGEPLGYNRNRFTILNAPYIAAERGGEDGDDGASEDKHEGENEHKRGDEHGSGDNPGYVYVAYFDGKTVLPTPIPRGATPQGPGNPFARLADIKVSRSRTDGTTWDGPVKVNDDLGDTTHVFPSIQVDREKGVHAAWTDRRLDRRGDILNDVWAALSSNRGASFGRNVRVTDVSTSWYQRADARPNFGDYNSSELLGFKRFVTTWSDGRFPPGTYVPAACTPAPPPGGRCPPTLAGTPDTLFAVVPDTGDGDDHHGREQDSRLSPLERPASPTHAERTARHTSDRRARTRPAALRGPDGRLVVSRASGQS